MIYYGLLLFFVFEYVRVGNFVPGVNALHLNSILPLSVFVGSVVSSSRAAHGDLLRETNTWRFLGLLIMIALSVLVAVVTMKMVETFTVVLGYVLIYYVIARQCTDLAHIKGVFKALIAVHLILIALTPQMLTNPGERHYMASGTFLGDGNDFALSVNMLVPLCLFLVGDAKRTLGRVVGTGVLVLLVIAIVATQSRGGTLALAAIGAYYWWKSPRKAVTGAGAVLAVLVVLAFAPSNYFDRMNTIATYETDGSAQGRITAWKAGTQMMLSNPILGVGAGQFTANYTRFAPGEVRWKTAHSIYFLILGELGLPGILLLLWIIFGNIVENRRCARTLRSRGEPESSRNMRLLACLSASMLAYGIAGAFLSAAYYPHMFVFAGLLTASRRFVLSERTAVESAVLAPSPVAVSPVPALVAKPLRPAQRGPRSLTPHHGRTV